MIALMGLLSRVLGVQQALDNTVIPGLVNNPWTVTALPENTTAVTLGGVPQCLNATYVVTSGTTKQTVVDVSGSGYIDFCASISPSATSSTVNVIITVDGVEIYNVTSVLNSTANKGLFPIADYSSGSLELSGGQPVYFRSSLKIEVQHTSSNNLWTYHRYTLAEPYSA